MIRLFLNLLFLSMGFTCLAELPPRPPQYVLLAFDGSLASSMWDATRAFSSEMKSKGADVRFTYFISGVYFLTEASRSNYQGPHHLQGSSAIGFGGQLSDVLNRAQNVNLAFSEKHEIGSHANGHFDGSKWTEPDWTQEFQLFKQFVFGFFNLNGFDLKTATWSGWILKESDVTGFRAPVLGISEGLYPALKAAQFRYDTSKTSMPGYWPRKSDLGIWNFPLASLTIAGTAMRTLSMDYNFYFAQSKGQADAAHAELFEKQMYETYLSYFTNSYQGNRAPIHIGHHFSLWNGAAYWKAMQHFAATVCSLPEVKCVTYKELTDYMETLTPQQIDDYSHGRFMRESAPKLAAVSSGAGGLDLKLQMHLASNEADENLYLVSQLGGADAGALLKRGARIEYYVDGLRQPFEGAGVHVSKYLTEARPSTKTIEARVFLGNRLLLHQTHRVQNNKISPDALEDRALQGDLPEAHLDEVNH